MLVLFLLITGSMKLGYFPTLRVPSRVLALAKHVIITPLPSVRSEYISKGWRKRTLQPWAHGSVVMQNWNQMNLQIRMQSWLQKKPDIVHVKIPHPYLKQNQQLNRWLWLSGREAGTNVARAGIFILCKVLLKGLLSRACITELLKGKSTGLD